MDGRIRGMLPQGLKPTLPFGALCRPATHPLGGFPGRALLQSSSTPSFSTGFNTTVVVHSDGLNPGLKAPFILATFREPEGPCSLRNRYLQL